MKKKFADQFTFEFWLNQPEDKRYEFKWYLPFLLYKLPYALAWGEWKKFDEYLKREHPIQFFFRDTLSVKLGQIENKFNRFYYKAKWLICNPRKEMRNKIFPAEYHDLPFIIEQFHFEVIKEFVDREKCFEYNSYEGRANLKFKKQLEKHYNWIVNERKTFSKNIEDLRNKKWIKAVQKMQKRDTEVMNWVIQNRERLWT